MAPNLTPDILLLAIVAVANVSIGTYVFLRKPEDRARQAFFLFVTGGALWVGGFVLLSLTHNFSFDIVTNYGGLLLIAGTLWFAQNFPRPIMLPVRSWLLYFPFLIIAAGVIPQQLIVLGIEPLPGGGFVPIVGPLLPLWSLIAVTYTLAAILILIYRFRRSTGRERLQLGYVFAGVSTFALSAVAFDMVLPVFGVTELKGIGPLTSIVFVGATAYAIARHQLMDIRIVIQRGFTYSVLLGLIVICYLSVLSVLGTLFPNEASGISLAASLVTITLGIIGVPYIERWFRKATDRIFFKGTYEYATALETLSAVLHANVELSDLVRESEQALARILRATSVRIALGQSAHKNAVLLVPIGLDGEHIGCIQVEAKRSGDPYTPQDLQLLKTFAYQAATALSRAQLYADVKEHARDLEAKVAERTRELSQTQARERQMLNDLSHNLQTPLTVLQTRLDRLKPILKDQAEVRALEQSLGSFSGFVYELLSLARLEGGRRVARIPLDLSALVSELVDEISVIAENRGIWVESRIDEGLYVKGDERQLREALMNLASNALKYLKPDGERSIAFTLMRESDAVVLEIRDTGTGIAPEDLPRIFERFYRGSRVRDDLQGTGLGLAIVKRIVEQHKGTVSAQSVHSQGTTMTVRLPLLSEH
ncbi:MAG TPA: ATP-binding protein [Candidatus Paceibacterota bacterium]